MVQSKKRIWIYTKRKRRKRYIPSCISFGRSGYWHFTRGGKDVFLHVSALEEAGIETLQEGQAVSFEIGENKGKDTAINIKKI